MKIVPFEPAHLAEIDPPVMTPDELRVFTKLYRPLWPAFTGVEAGKAAICAGFVINGKTGQVWAVLSDSIRGKPFALHRAVKCGMERIIEQRGLGRLEATCHARFPAAQRWLERLDFRLSTNCEVRIGGQPYLRYVRDI